MQTPNSAPTDHPPAREAPIVLDYTASRTPKVPITRRNEISFLLNALAFVPLVAVIALRLRSIFWTMTLLVIWAILVAACLLVGAARVFDWRSERGIATTPTWLGTIVGLTTIGLLLLQVLLLWLFGRDLPAWGIS